MKPTQLFVAGTHTDAGKTLVSAILCAGLGAAYWKPIQTGADPVTGVGGDRLWVSQAINNESHIDFPEAYIYPLPQSPNIAAAAAGSEIELDKIILPDHPGSLIIEGAGGVLVPLNQQYLQIDLIAKLKIPVVLVSPLYLGTINHTLLSIQALRNRGIPLLGLIFNGESHPEVEDTIRHFGKTPVIGRVPLLTNYNRSTLLSVYQSFTLS